MRVYPSALSSPSIVQLLRPRTIKRILAISLFSSLLLTFCLLSSSGAKAQQNGDPTYYATNYGVKGDDKTDDTQAMQALLNLVSSKGGGLIQIPCNGTWTLIASGTLQVPGNVNLEGCGKYGDDFNIPASTPPGGFDLRYNGEYKMEWLSWGQNTVRDMAFVDFNTNPTECAPFFYISNSVVDFEHFSVQGNVTAPNQTGSCQTVFTFGANVVDCGGGGTHECFNGYGTEIFDGYLDKIQYAAIYNAGADGIYWLQDLGTSNNGNYQGKDSPQGSAFIFNATNAGHGLLPYGNTFQHIQWEMGDAQKPFHTNYIYAVDIQCCAGTNYFYDFDCADNEQAKACIHEASAVAHHIDHQYVDGCETGGWPFPGCFAQDDLPTNYYNVFIDSADDLIMARQIFGTDLGSRTQGYNDLNLVPGGYIYAREGTPPAGSPGADILWGDSNAHRFMMNNNSGSPVQVVGSGADIDKSDRVVKVNGGAVPASAGLVGTNAFSQFIDAGVPVGTVWRAQNTGNALLGTPIQALPFGLVSGTYQINITLAQTSAPTDCDILPLVELFLGFTDLTGGYTVSPTGTPWVTVFMNGVTALNALQLAPTANRTTTGTAVFQLSFKTGTPFTYQVYQSGNATKGGGPCLNYPIVKSTVTTIGPLL